MSKFFAKCIKNARVPIICVACSVIICALASAQERTIPPVPDKRDTVAFGFYTKMLVETDIKDARSAIDYWMKILAKRLNLEMEGYIYNDIDSLHEDFKNGLLDWINITPNNYLQSMNDIEAEFGPIPLIAGRKTRNYFLMVQSNSTIKDVKDLRGKKLAIMKENEGGKIYLNTFLLQNKLKEIDSFFSAVLEKRTFAQAILAVFFRQADACIAADYAINTLTELNPQIRDQLRILAASPTLINAVSLFRKNLDENIKKILTNTICNLDETIEGRQVKILFRIDGMAPAQESDIESFKQLIQQYTKLKGKDIKSKSVSKTTNQ